MTPYRIDTESGGRRVTLTEKAATVHAVGIVFAARAVATPPAEPDRAEAARLAAAAVQEFDRFCAAFARN